MLLFNFIKILYKFKIIFLTYFNYQHFPRKYNNQTSLPKNKLKKKFFIF